MKPRKPWANRHGWSPYHSLLDQYYYQGKTRSTTLAYLFQILLGTDARAPGPPDSESLGIGKKINFH